MTTLAAIVLAFLATAALLVVLLRLLLPAR
ncbi:hypothetical protein V1279_005402 [Bradyrhizobium sp. AZCC 1610]